jgi:bacterial/archaeal transporter family protein
MDRWVWFAVASMLFAGVTAVLAKHGLAGISAELGLAVRTLCAFVFAFALVAVPAGEVWSLTRANVCWLALSALTTAASWVFYYKALKDGDVSTVALIDKGSFVVAAVLAWLFLGEKLTPRVLFGGALIVCGLLVVARK